MKAQAVLAGALIAAVIFASVGTVVAGISYRASLFQPSSINMQNAEFDIESITYSSTYLGGCIKSANASCTSTLLRSINEHYRLSYSKLQVGGAISYSGNYLRCGNSDYFCFPVSVNLSYEQVCEYMCSD